MNKPCFLQNLTIVGATSAISIIGLGISNLSAQAAVITNGCTAVDVFCTLEELNNGGTIQVGDKLFTDWDVLTASKSFPILPIPLNLANIEVSGIFQDTNAPGLEFMSVNNELFTTSGSIDLVFDFLVTSLGEPIVDNELFLTDASAFGDITGGTSTILIQESVGTSKGSQDIAFKDVFIIARGGVIPPGIPGGEEKLFDSADFSPQESVWIRKDISLEAEGVEGLARLDKFQQRFSQQAPEPASVLGILAIGSLGLSLKRKKQL